MDFKTKPFAHQLAEFERSALLPSRALFWEQGTGKTWYGLNSTAAAFRAGQIDGTIIVAPSGVERNWITDEFPAHFPDDIPIRPHIWSTHSAKAKWHKKSVDDLLKKVPGTLPVLVMNYDAWLTDECKKAAWALMRSRPVYLHVDESAHLKGWSTKRTTSITKAAPFARMTRIYSGTPVDNNPFDLYSQVHIVDRDFWMREFSLPGWFDFQHFFGVFAREERRDGKHYPVLASFQNIGLLRDALKKISDRVLKDDVLDLPPKSYTRRYYEMSTNQARVYDQLENEFAADFPDDPEALITAELPIVRMLRLQQVLCGYVPADGDEEPRELIDPKHNPRLDATAGFIEEAGNQQTIVWAQYRLDVDLIMERLRGLGRRPVRYDGKVTEDERAIAKAAFQKGDASDFVANPSVGADGLTLVQAHTVAFHNNNYRMGKRKQAEDRAHRIGQQHPVLYGDMICRGTRDENAIRILQRKHRMSETVLGDAPKEWL